MSKFKSSKPTYRQWFTNGRLNLPSVGDIVLFNGLLEVIIVRPCVNGFYVKEIKDGTTEFRATYEKLFPKPLEEQTTEDTALTEFKERLKQLPNASQ